MDKKGSGDFLEDVDIIIVIRSGKTDLSELQKLMNAIVASSTSLVDTKIVLTESEAMIRNTPSGSFAKLSSTLFI